jgi:hypothetical protein
MLFLRETDAAPRSPRVSKEALAGAAAKLAKHLEEIAG